MNAPSRPFTPQAVHSRLRNRNWQLIDPHKSTEWERFLDDVAELLRAGDASSRPAAERLDRAVIGAYCTILYTACVANGTYDQHRAYTEVWNWVYPILAKRTNSLEDAEDIAQDVMLYVFQNLQRVYRPSGFLTWVGSVAFKRLRRYYTQIGAERRRFIDEFPDEDTDEPNPIIPTTDANLPAARVELTDTEVEMLAILDQCLPPQARTQKFVFIDLILHQHSMSEIAQKRKLTVEAVHVAWSRIRRALKDGCAEIIEKLIFYLDLRNAPST